MSFQDEKVGDLIGALYDGQFHYLYGHMESVGLYK